MRTGILTLLLAGAAVAGDDEPLKLERTIPLEGVKGRIDHMALSADGNRLAVAALGNDTIEIVDPKAARVVHRITGIGAPTAGAFVDGRLVMASADDGKLHVFDGSSFEQIGTTEVGDDADPVRFDGTRVYVGVGEGAMVIVEKGAKTAEIPLAAHPEGFQVEAKGTRIFVNLPDVAQVAVIDREKRKVVATWEMTGATANYPMALDEENGRVLVGCRLPARLMVHDAADGSVKANVEISGDVDDLFRDPKTRRIYASCGEGFVDVIEERGRDHYERIARVPTAHGARTCHFDPEGGRLFVAAPKRGDKPAAILVYRTAQAPAGN